MSTMQLAAVPAVEMREIETVGKTRLRKYTPKTVNAIRLSLSLGNTRRAACEAAGVDRKTLWIWMQDETRMTFGVELAEQAGPDGQAVVVEVAAPIVTFKEMVVQAEAFASVQCITIVAQAARGGAIKSRRTYTRRNGDVIEEVEYTLPNWQAAMALQERKYPGEWGVKKREDDYSHLSDEQLLALLAEDPAVGTVTDDTPKQLTTPGEGE